MSLREYLRSLRGAVSSRRLPGNVSSLIHGAAEVVASSYSLHKRRRAGIFLSTPLLAAELVKNHQLHIATAAPVLDPAMGCADLLLACATRLPRRRSLAATLQLWSDVMWGFETNEDLIAVGKLRLVLLARILHPNSSGVGSDEIARLFGNFAPADFLASNLSKLPRGLCVVANPPFTLRAAPRASATRSGTASAAALFLEKICREGPELSQISMLLPEVLRCGTSYRKLRAEIAQYVEVVDQRSLKRRDCWPDVDIDVFIGQYRRLSPEQVFAPDVVSRNAHLPSRPGKRLDELADLRVGPVVPYRTPHTGPWRKYITARSVPAWADRHVPLASRRYDGPFSQPPFLVVRRTSRPDRPYRAVGSLIVGEAPVAVENHLIIVKPKDGRLATCQDLLWALKGDAVNEQLDETMRCRHLTVESLKALQVSI